MSFSLVFMLPSSDCPLGNVGLRLEPLSTAAVNCRVQVNFESFLLTTVHAIASCTFWLMPLGAARCWFMFGLCRSSNSSMAPAAADASLCTGCADAALDCSELPASWSSSARVPRATLV